MKNKKFIFRIWLLLLIPTFILSASSLSGQTNTYHPFPDSAIWRVDYKVHFPVQFPCTKYYYLEYYSIGDTVINSHLYSKIFLNEIHDSIDCNWGPYFPPVSGYNGALRDDPSANKTFFVYPGSNTDSLLYDYNMKVGDTLKGIPAQFFSTYDTNNTVISIDSVLIQNSYRKRWNFTQSILGDSVFIIEGIGTSSGLIEPLYPWVSEWTNRHLICVEDSIETYFLSAYPSLIGCNQVVSVRDNLDLRNQIRIYPNPFSDKITITADKELINSTILIIDSFGNTVKQLNNIKGKEITLSIENLSGGIYFLRIIQENGTTGTFKLIKIEK